MHYPSGCRGLGQLRSPYPERCTSSQHNHETDQSTGRSRRSGLKDWQALHRLWSQSGPSVLDRPLRNRRPAHPQPAGSGFCSNKPDPEMGGRHCLHLDAGGLAVSGYDHRSLLPPFDRLGSRQQAEERLGNSHIENGDQPAQAPHRLRSSY